jgi:sugar transferase (PEP-CTERM/EpsH1 system associated)
MEVMTVELALRLKARGHRVGVTCIHDLGLLAERLERAEIPVSLVRVPGFRPNLFPERLATHFRERELDIVHSHTGAWLKVAHAARRAGVAGTVHTVHGLENEVTGKDRAVMFAGALFTDVVAAVSHPLRDYLTREVRIPARKVRVLINGIDVARFTPEGEATDLRAHFGLPPDAVLVGIVARFAPVKDHATLIAAFDRVARSEPRAHLVLVGEGELRTAIEQDVARLDLAGRVHFLGSVGDTAPVYRGLDILTLSSLSEGTSMSILEGLATGLPVVATSVGGNPDLVQEGVQGHLVPSRDPRALAEGLVRLVRDPEHRRAAGIEARKRAVAEFSLTGMVEQYESLYEELAGG